MKIINKTIILFLLLIFFTRFIYVIHEYNHDCKEDNCPICEIINNYNHDMKKIVPNLINVIFIIVSFIISIPVFKRISNNKIINTLISLKVELLS